MKARSTLPNVGFYSRYVLPKVIHFACRMEPNNRQREKIVPRAKGRVLEIGAGSGLNLPFYDAAQVDHLSALEPAAEMWAMAGESVRKAGFPVEFIQAFAESIPLDDDSVDTVLVTYSLCTIPSPVDALREMRRAAQRSPVSGQQHRQPGPQRPGADDCNANHHRRRDHDRPAARPELRFDPDDLQL